MRTVHADSTSSPRPARVNRDFTLPRIDALEQRDYNSHMITSLRESKARLSELVERASQGEDVLISVRGKVKARLTRAVAPAREADRSAWLRELRALQKANATGKPKITVEQILAQDREDRA